MNALCSSLSYLLTRTLILLKPKKRIFTNIRPPESHRLEKFSLNLVSKLLTISQSSSFFLKKGFAWKGREPKIRARFFQNNNDAQNGINDNVSSHAWVSAQPLNPLEGRYNLLMDQTAGGQAMHQRRHSSRQTHRDENCNNTKMAESLAISMSAA